MGDNYYNGDNSRDGYQSHNNRSNDERSSRSRFSRNAVPVNGNSYGAPRGERSFRPRTEGGFQQRDGGNRWSKQRFTRHEGEQGSYQFHQRSFNPRYNQNNEGYSRGNDNNYSSYDRQRSEQSYGYRQGGNGYDAENGGGDYRANNGGYRANNGGYRPRNNGQNRSFGNRPSQRRGGYDPHAKYSQKKRFEYKEENYDPTVPIRLNKFLANAGVCSRRDADKYIEAGVVSVNGVVVTELGAKVLRTDEVKFHDNAVKIEKKVYVLLNKPKGYVTTSEDPQNRKTVMDLVQNACPERIYPVGRLDRNTTGVLLLTNDGGMASKLTHPKFLKKKIYHVTTDQNVSAADIRQIAEGITLEDGEIKADAIEYASETDKKQVGIEIHSGKNRIVRRIFESLGYHVVKLDRVYFAGLTKKNVRRGDWRYLTEKEVQMLRMGAFE